MSGNPKVINLMLNDDALDYYKHLRRQKVRVSPLFSSFLRELSKNDPSYTPSEGTSRPDVYGEVDKLLSKMKNNV